MLVHDGRVCLIRRQRPAGEQLSFPGGVAEDGEDPAEALRRELLEELGLDLAVLPDRLHRMVAVAEQDDQGRASVEWIPLADAADLHLAAPAGTAASGRPR
ncbi:NUDIX domain-containing protein [Kitasatospora sp. NPDC085464]|uniref:NUDIX domain-containing protein n=1 Tax=Kitasatospora sp. NPDC085464 TaxID=3364063 RepID=UPI0037C6795D